MMDGHTLFLLACYFAPALVAAFRHHHNQGAIALLNLLLGWTVIGWIVALIWAATEPRWRAEQRARQMMPPSAPSNPAPNNVTRIYS